MKKTTDLLLLLMIGVVTILLTCSCRQRIEGVFATPKLQNIQRMAVLGLTPEQEQIFMANYLQIFRDQPVTFVERSALNKVLGEQNLLRDDQSTPLIDEGRLNEKTRARLKQLLGVEALAICSYYQSPDRPTLKKFLVRIVMTETGAIVASAIVEARDHFQYHSYTAIKKIHEYLRQNGRVSFSNPYPSEDSLR